MCEHLCSKAGSMSFVRILGMQFRLYAIQIMIQAAISQSILSKDIDALFSRVIWSLHHYSEVIEPIVAILE